MSAGFFLGLLALGAVAVADQNYSMITFQVCGPLLADTVSEVCNSMFFRSLEEKSQQGETAVVLKRELVNVPPSKRSTFARLLFFRHLGLYLETDGSYSRKMARSTTRRRKGIVDECCHRPCNWHQMRRYCA